MSNRKTTASLTNTSSKTLSSPSLEKEISNSLPLDEWEIRNFVRKAYKVFSGPKELARAFRLPTAHILRVAGSLIFTPHLLTCLHERFPVAYEALKKFYSHHPMARLFTFEEWLEIRSMPDYHKEVRKRICEKLIDYYLKHRRFPEAIWEALGLNPQNDLERQHLRRILRAAKLSRWRYPLYVVMEGTLVINRPVSKKCLVLYAMCGEYFYRIVAWGAPYEKLRKKLQIGETYIFIIRRVRKNGRLHFLLIDAIPVQRYFLTPKTLVESFKTLLREKGWLLEQS